MRFLELFAGAGGMSLGLERAGMTCVGHAEIEPHARAVLRSTWPTVPLYGDVTTLDGAALMAAHRFDVLTGGSPCQDLSVAGKRAGLDGSRSSLFYTQARLWEESGAPYLLWENVYGALNSNKGADFAVVLSTLVGRAMPVPRDGWRRGGVASGPSAVAAWRVLDLQHVPGDEWPAPPQRRVRVFVLAARSGGVDPAEVLALSEGVCGHPAPREQAREGSAGRAVPRAAECRAVGRAFRANVGGNEGAGAGGGEAEAGAQDGVGALALNTSDGVPRLDDVMGTLDQDGASTTAIGAQTRGVVLAFTTTQTPKTGDNVALTLEAASKSGGGQVQSVLAFDTTQITSAANRSNPQPGDPCHTLAGGAHPPLVLTYDARGNGDGATVNTLAGDHQNRVTDYTALLVTGPVTHSLTHEGADASEDGTGRGTPIVVASGQANAEIGQGIAPTLTILHEAPYPVSGRPRRLTPLECERLMAWPDHHTAFGVNEKGKRYALKDTARYRLCGNGIGSTQAEWIGRNLLAAEDAA